MKYKSNPKMQGAYAVVTFLLALAIIYVATGEINWVISIIAGVGEFVVSGFYDYKKGK